MNAHNPKVIGSNPIPATKQIKGFGSLPNPFFGLNLRGEPSDDGNTPKVAVDCLIWTVHVNARLRGNCVLVQKIISSDDGIG